MSSAVHISPDPDMGEHSAGEASKHVAVAVGVSYTEYYLNTAHQPMSAYTATSGTLSVVCGRLSFTLNLKVTPHGPLVSTLILMPEA